MKIRNTMTGVIETVELYPYQQQTLNRINSHSRSTVLYGRQMGLTLTMAYKALVDLRDGKKVLYITNKLTGTRTFMDRLRVNLSGESQYTIEGNQVLVGNDVRLCTETFHYHVSLDVHYYDTIIVDEAQFQSEKFLVKLLELTKNFKGNLIFANTATSDHYGTFYNLCHDNNYEHVVARYFIHPSFNKEFYDQTVAYIGTERYRRQYEVRW